MRWWFVRVLAGAWVILGLLAPGAMAATEPVVSTGTATAITSTSAKLNGTVNPGGEATSFYFQYGTTTSYGTQTATSPVGSGDANVDVTASIGSLTPDTIYHYRLVAVNASGTTLGGDVSFTTPKRPAPVALTGHAGSVTQTSARLTGTVDPEGEATSYLFQYGTSSAYGSQTATGDGGSGTATVSVSAAIGPLTPSTTYHYRLVATNAAGAAYGHDVTFKTASVPAGVTIAASPATITFGQGLSISGHVLAPRPSRATVTLQSAPTAGGPWADAATTTAASSGAYVFRPASPASDTYYRALSDGATSAPVLVSVRFRIGLRVSRLRPPPGGWVWFHGQAAPAHGGLRVLVQWLGPRGRWHAVKITRLRGAGAGFSVYRVHVRIERSGRYRVVVGPDFDHAQGRSRAVRIRLR
ncbi:MAG TPA: hypothetical protein VME22_20755 [Solirubrobacteraceae bacterium]|nr:hypothetical protein [Solirubrobacteraceae bacterium]